MPERETAAFSRPDRSLLSPAGQGRQTMMLSQKAQLRNSTGRGYSNERIASAGIFRGPRRDPARPLFQAQVPSMARQSGIDTICARPKQGLHRAFPFPLHPPTG